MKISYSFKDFVKEYYNFYKDDKYDKKILDQINEFKTNYPFDKLNELKINDYCRNKRSNEVKPSFIRSLEYLTDALVSSKTGKLEYRIFYEKNNSFHIYDKYKNIFKGNSVEEKFNNFKERMIDFIKNFNPKSYNHDQFLPSSMNVFKAKLIFLYRFNLQVYGFSSKYKAKAFADSIGVSVSNNDDTLDLLIKIKDVVSKYNLGNKYENLTVARMYWLYYEKFIDLSNCLEQEEQEEQAIKSSLAKERIEKYELQKVKRNYKNVKIALQCAKGMCEYNSVDDCFKKRNGNENYLECHHLVPYNIKTVKYFPNANLDDPKNIVCLCASCHMKIHHGYKTIAKPIIKALYELRKTQLESININIELEDLYKLYGF